jgi:hypothetical protein
MKAHLVKGSAAAKAYMAKLRSKKKKVGAVKKKAVKKAAPKKKAVKKAVAKSLHKDTKSHNVNIRVVSGISKSKKLQKDLKTKGLKLTHGYTVASRKIGSLQTDKIKKSLDWINMYNEQLDFWKSFNPGMDKNYKKQKLDSIKFYRKSLIEEKKHFTELKKLLK